LAKALIRRGQIWWVDFGEPRDSEPTFRHPALVLQRDEVNASKLATVVVCVLTSTQALAAAPGNTLLPKRFTGLPKDSVANASQIATVNKDDLHQIVGTVPRQLLDKVAAGLRWFLQLES
jgi:mRNA interferase MazF